MKPLKFFFLALTCFFGGAVPFAWGQTQPVPEAIAAEVKEMNEESGKRFGFQSKEPAAPKEGNPEKSTASKIIETVKLEKVERGLPGVDQMQGERHYSLRLQNSQKIFTLYEKYDFNLFAGVGIIAKTSPQMVRGFWGKDPLSGGKPGDGESFIEDKGVAIGLEIKF